MPSPAVRYHEQETSSSISKHMAYTSLAPGSYQMESLCVSFSILTQVKTTSTVKKYIFLNSSIYLFSVCLSKPLEFSDVLQNPFQVLTFFTFFVGKV